MIDLRIVDSTQNRNASMSSRFFSKSRHENIALSPARPGTQDDAQRPDIRGPPNLHRALLHSLAPLGPR